MYKSRNILFLLVVVLVAIGCKDEVKSLVTQPTDPETTPTVLTKDIVTLVSDSGVMKYRISAQRWDIFEESQAPGWRFPTGLFLEQFDTELAVAATFKCDSAIFFKNDKLWRFMGNVRSWNIKKELILTNELFWDQKNRKVYSDSFIHIERPDRVLEGFGFESNEQLTTYRLKRPMGIFPVNEMRGDSAANDSSASTSASLLPVETPAPKAEAKPTLAPQNETAKVSATNKLEINDTKTIMR